MLQLFFLALAVLCYIAAKAKHSPVMPAEVYGEWVTSYPAENWAVSLMLASAVYLAGIIINGAWRWSPALRLTGAAWHTITLGMFSIGSSEAQFGDVFSLATALLMGINGWFCWLNIMDLRRAVGNVATSN